MTDARQTTPFEANPPPLILSPDATGALLREALPDYENGLGGVEAWMRSSARTAPARSSSWWRVLIAVPVAACLILLVARAIQAPPRSQLVKSVVTRGPHIVPLPATLTAEPLDAAADPSTLGLSRRKGRPLVARRQAQRLLAGIESALADGSRLRLSRDGAATLRAATPARTTVALEHGTVSLAVARRRAGESFEVRAGEYRFRVVGTRFVVTATSEQIDLVVTEGTVVVMAGGADLRRIDAGQRWSAPRATAAGDGAGAGDDEADGPGAAPAGEARPNPTDCQAIARSGAARKALVCYEAVAAGNDLHAEMGLFEVARLRRDALADPKGALAALTLYQTRFPRGALREEALGELLDLQVRTGDAQRALATSEALLARGPSAERRAQLHLVRGNVLRTLEHDYRRAAVEYARVEAGAEGALADEGLYWRAVCLQEIGERERARTAFTRYLQRPAPDRATDARARLDELKP